MARLSIIKRHSAKGEQEYLRLYYKNLSGSPKRCEILKPYNTGDLDVLADIASEMEYQRKAGKTDYSFDLRQKIKYQINTKPVRELFVKAKFLSAERQIDYSFDKILERITELLQTRFEKGELTSHSLNKRMIVVRKFGEFLDTECGDIDDLRDVDKSVAKRYVDWCMTRRTVKGKLKVINSETANQEKSWISKVFKDLVELGYFPHNPFEGIKVQVISKDTRRVIIPRFTLDQIEAYLEATCKGNKRGWYIYFMITRYCGSRKTEALQLQWRDVNFDALNGMGQIMMPSPKTSKKTGKIKRRVPLMNGTGYALVDCGLKECLLEEYNSKEPSPEDYIINGVCGLTNSSRASVDWKNINPSTTLEKRIIDAGWCPWPKLCQNMRVTRVNELARSHWLRPEALHSMIGHDEDAYRKNYAEVTDDDFLGTFKEETYDDQSWNPEHRLHYSPSYSPSFTTSGKAHSKRTLHLRPEKP